MQLLFVGDIALADENLSHSVWAPPGGMVPGDDMRIVFNWELPVGTIVNPVPRSSGPRLLSDPDSPRVLRRWSPGFATLATNHILDAGDGGLGETIQQLNRMGFITVGAGRTRQEIAEPLFWETAEGRLAIVNWVFQETHPDWMRVPGPNCWPGVEGARQTIQDLKVKAEWVIAVVHWSDELFSYPRPEDRLIAQELADVGTDVIVGHHPHVVRGMEIIGSCPVFYSIGNFYFSNIADGRGGWITRLAPRNREGLGIHLSFMRGQRPEYKIMSFWQSGGWVIDDRTHRAFRRMKLVSRPLKKLKRSRYEAWYEIRRGRFEKWGGRWHFGVRRLGTLGTIRRVFRMLSSHLHSLACTVS